MKSHHAIAVLITAVFIIGVQVGLVWAEKLGVIISDGREVTDEAAEKCK